MSLRQPLPKTLPSAWLVRWHMPMACSGRSRVKRLLAASMLLCGLMMMLCAHAGNQKEEALADSVRIALSRAITDPRRRTVSGRDRAINHRNSRNRSSHATLTRTLPTSIRVEDQGFEGVDPPLPDRQLRLNIRCRMFPEFGLRSGHHRVQPPQAGVGSE